jgi:hypothetical protein
MARDLRTHFSERDQMATRMNMLKLLQEVEGFATFTTRRPQGRPNGAFVLQLRSINFRRSIGRSRRIVRVDMQEPTDIASPVAIKHLRPRASASAATA